MSGENSAGWAGRTKRWVRLAAVVIALVCIIVFGFALANVTMRLQRHITARAQWKTDRTKMAMDYANLLSAAAAGDDLAYGLVSRVAWNDSISLQRDSAAMPTKGNAQRMALVKQVQGCLATSVTAFNAQTVEARAACGQLMAAQP